MMIATELRPRAPVPCHQLSNPAGVHLHTDPELDAAGLVIMLAARSLDANAWVLDLAAEKRAYGTLHIIAYDASMRDIGQVRIKCALEADDRKHCLVPLDAGVRSRVHLLRLHFDPAPQQHAR